MLFSATVKHKTAGRIRLLFAKNKGDASFFRLLEQKAATLRQVTSVTSNPLTGSLTIHYGGDPDQFAHELRHANLFKLVDDHAQDQLTPDLRFREALASLLKQWDESIQSASGGEMNLSLLAFMSLGGLALWQIKRGKFLPAGLTLLMQGSGFLKMYR